MSSKIKVSGYNDRYSNSRFRGVVGSHGENVFPLQNEDIIAIADPAGTYDGVLSIPAASTSIQVLVDVTQIFDGGATLIVGYAGDTDLLVTLVDAVDLTTLGLKVVVVEVTWPAAAVARATIGGAPTQGAGTVTVQWEV